MGVAVLDRRRPREGEGGKGTQRVFFSGFLGFLGIYMVVKGCDGSGGAEAEF